MLVGLTVEKNCIYIKCTTYCKSNLEKIPLITPHQHHEKNPTDTEEASRWSSQYRLMKVTGKARSYLAM